MKKRTLSLVIAVTLTFTVQSQVTAPALNAPKLTIPATFAGKLKLADSLQKLKTPAGVMLKNFMPQYTPQFQDQLIEDLIIVAKVQWELNNEYGYRYIIKDLVNTVRTEYPQITRASIYKIFYTMCYKMFFLVPTWGWDLDEVLAVAYGERKHYLSLTGPKFLKEANVDISTVFYSYSGYANVYQQLAAPEFKLPADTIRKYSAQTLISNMLRAGYTPDVIYDHIKKSGLRDKYWVEGFCKANVEVGNPVETVARILKKDYISDAELVYLLSSVPGYNSQENLLKAQRTN